MPERPEDKLPNVPNEKSNEKPFDEAEKLNQTNAALKAKLAEYEKQIATAATEEKRLELEERQINIETKRRVLADLRQKESTRKVQLQMAQQQLQAQLAVQKALQDQCTHMKGGVVTSSDPSVVMNGHGSDATDYCIIKHVLPSGRLMILCSRCLKEWYSHDPLTGEVATEGFETAKRWPTKNHISGSSQFWPVRHAPISEAAVR